MFARVYVILWIVWWCMLMSKYVNMSMLIRFKVLMCISINLMWLRKKNIKEKIMSFIQSFIPDCNPLSILLVDLSYWNLYQWIRAHSYCWAGLSPPVSSLWGWCSSNTFSWLPQVTQVLESYLTNIYLMYKYVCYGFSLHACNYNTPYWSQTIIVQTVRLSNIRAISYKWVKASES